MLFALVALAGCNCGLKVVRDCSDGSCDGGSGGGMVSGGGSVTGGGSAGGGSFGGGSVTGGGAANDAGSGCSALALGECRRRSDCAADTCFQCNCTPIFHGCREINAPPFQCPAVGCPQPLCCADGSTCPMSLACAPVNQPVCGQCIIDPGSCTQDSNCASTEICEPIACACAGAKACVAGCDTTHPCEAFGTTCGPHGRCTQLSCSGTSPCPPGSTCVNGACQPQPCTTDLNCDDGVCAFGRCSRDMGACRPEAP